MGPDLAWEVGRRRARDAQADQGRPPRRRALPRARAARRTPGCTPLSRSAIVRAHNLFCRPALVRAETDEFWEEWRRMGRLIGVRYEDLPETWPGLLATSTRWWTDELEDTEAAQDVLTSLLSPTAPPLPGIARLGLASGELALDQGGLAGDARACCRPICGSGSGWSGRRIARAPLPPDGGGHAAGPPADAAAGPQLRTPLPALAPRGDRAGRRRLADGAAALAGAPERPMAEIDHPAAAGARLHGRAAGRRALGAHPRRGPRDLRGLRRART